MVRKRGFAGCSFSASDIQGKQLILTRLSSRYLLPHRVSLPLCLSMSHLRDLLSSHSLTYLYHSVFPLHSFIDSHHSPVKNKWHQHKRFTHLAPLQRLFNRRLALLLSICHSLIATVRIELWAENFGVNKVWP